MKQNKYFNISRFAVLYKQDLFINHKTYLFAMLGLVLGAYAFCFFVFSIMRAKIYNIYDYVPMLTLFLMSVGVVIGNSFPALKNKIRSSSYLLLPGSTLEKFLVQLINRIILLIPIALALFWVGANLAKLSLISDPALKVDPSKIPAFNYVDLFKGGINLRDKVAIILSIFSLTSVLFAGSAYFNRHALVKTLIAFAIGIVSVLLTMVLCSHIFFPDFVTGLEIHIPDYRLAEDLFNVHLFIYAIGGLSWLFFLPLTYFKLKEKEV